MHLIERVELDHAEQIAAYRHRPLPGPSWKTPDGQRWSLPDILQGFKRRASDRWAWCTLHDWLAAGVASVFHIDLPTGLMRHDPDDPVWRHVVGMHEHGQLELEPAAPAGTADFAITLGKPPVRCMVEMGHVAPIKFVINLGRSLEDWMLVPYACPFAFVFASNAPLSRG